MQSVPEMNRDISRLGGECDHGKAFCLTRAWERRDPTVGASDHEQLAGSGSRRVELDADVEHRALDRVPAHSAVAVPRQIGETRGGAGHLYHDAVPV